LQRRDFKVEARKNPSDGQACRIPDAIGMRNARINNPNPQPSERLAKNRRLFDAG
jgi:hypothetical protein